MLPLQLRFFPGHPRCCLCSNLRQNATQRNQTQSFRTYQQLIRVLRTLETWRAPVLWAHQRSTALGENEPESTRGEFFCFTARHKTASDVFYLSSCSIP